MIKIYDMNPVVKELLMMHPRMVISAIKSPAGDYDVILSENCIVKICDPVVSVDIGGNKEIFRITDIGRMEVY